MNDCQTYYTYYKSQLGILLLININTSLSGIYFTHQKNTPFIQTDWYKSDQHFTNIKTQLDEYFMGKRTYFDLTYKIQGSEFQKSIWQQLTKIEYGNTCSYKDIANTIGNPYAARAVGTAIGMNPLSIVLPCHRVIKSDGSLGGYAGGLLIKQSLLSLESK